MTSGAPPPVGLLGVSITDAEKKLGEIIGKITDVAEFLDGGWVGDLIPAQYKAGLDEIVKILQAADGFLNKTA